LINLWVPTIASRFANIVHDTVRTALNSPEFAAHLASPADTSSFL
jgi:hypothetical protein